MKLMHQNVVQLGLLSVALLPAALSAGENEGHELAVGLMAFTGDSIYRDGDNHQEVIPVIDWQWNQWFFSDYSLGRYLVENDDWEVSLAIDYDAFGDVDRGDSRTLSDMKPLEDAFNLALSGSVFTDWGLLSLTLQRDISNKHQGESLTLAYALPMELDHWTITPALSTQYANGELVNYYVGVRAADVKPERQLYRAGSGFRNTAGISVTRFIYPAHMVIFDLGYTWFSDSITDSPIVEDSDTTSFSVGYVYAF